MHGWAAIPSNNTELTVGIDQSRGFDYSLLCLYLKLGTGITDVNTGIPAAVRLMTIVTVAALP